MDMPKIRQVLFKIEGNRNYHFDVNQTITIRGLKRMISVAAGLPKIGLKIFHKEEEFTDYDDSSLNELFPELAFIEFSIALAMPLHEERESKIKLKIGDYCQSHNYKYLYFYCYDCKKSLCSVCVQGLSHKSHKVIEKYDYLQNSRHLVDVIFKDINQYISDPKNSTISDAEHLKKRIKQVYFFNLHEMLTNVELKIIDLIDYYVQTSENSIRNINSNVEMIKTHCTNGLDQLKEEIEIEKIMMNEEIFIIFDKKYSDMANEQSRLIEESKKVKELNSHFKCLSETVDAIYNDTYKFLDEKLNLEVYSDLRKQIHASLVGVITKEEIFDKILSDVKGKKSGRKSYNKTSILDKSIDPVMSVNSSITERNLFSIFASENAMGAPVENGSSDDIRKEKAKSPGQDQGSSMNNAIKYIMTIHPETKEVVVFNDENNTLEPRELDFPQFSGIPHFLKFCSTSNYNGKLYISGGKINLDSSSHSFVMYDPLQQSLVRLPDMINPRYSHSILAHDDFIYAVGGYRNNTCEKYDIQKTTWIKLSDLNTEERQYPILHVIGNFLYAFFGYTIGTYIETVEKINIKNLKAKWEVVPYKNPDKLDLKIMGCGIVPCEANELYFFGGKTKDSMKSDAFKFNFNKNMFTLYEAKMEDPTYFSETTLIKLGGQSYGHFDSDSGSHFIRIQLV